jgi:hypothetical protein
LGPARKLEEIPKTCDDAQDESGVCEIGSGSEPAIQEATAEVADDDGERELETR